MKMEHYPLSLITLLQSIRAGALLGTPPVLGFTFLI